MTPSTSKKGSMTKQEMLYSMQLLAVLTLRFFGFGYFGIRHLPEIPLALALGPICSGSSQPDRRVPSIATMPL